MEIKIYTDNPSELRRIIFEKVENEELETWYIRNANGTSYLTHTGQWEDKALLNLTVADDILNIRIVHWKNEAIPTDAIKSVYLGRFTEALLNHFNEYYNSFEIFY